jgi:glycosyltransferase involved in cell wall biosynthesis
MKFRQARRPLLRTLGYLAGLAARGHGQTGGFPESGLIDVMRRLPPEDRNAVLPAVLRPTDAWHSYDLTPWAHPWLIPGNLSATRSFERDIVQGLVARYGGEIARDQRYAFIGNLANNMALRALPLRKRGYSVDLFLHPQDRYVMSQPGWELADMTLLEGESSIDQLEARNARLPEVAGVFTLPIDAGDQFADLMRAACSTPKRDWPSSDVPSFVRQSDVLLWPAYFTFLSGLKALQDYACLFAAQAPYLAYLSNRPYLAAQTGGDFWFEASRNDSFGLLQRRSYGAASAILATNPWAYSTARRFGFRNVIYAPLIIDTEAYVPGPSPARQVWQQEVGGDFFALVTARIDRRWKASHIGIEGFLRFAQSHPQARLVVVGWGEDSFAEIEELKMGGLEGRLVRLPISGKRKLIEYLRGADCLIDQFAIGYYGATALESMSTGLPVIMNVLREQYDALCPTGSPPVLSAMTPSEVASQLERLASSKEQRHHFSTASRHWVEQNHSVEVWGETYGAILNGVASGAKLDFSKSPLANPLSPIEQAYHAEMLASAPTFPNYAI